MLASEKYVNVYALNTWLGLLLCKYLICDILIFWDTEFGLYWKSTIQSKLTQIKVREVIIDINEIFL